MTTVGPASAGSRGQVDVARSVIQHAACRGIGVPEVAEVAGRRSAVGGGRRSLVADRRSQVAGRRSQREVAVVRSVIKHTAYRGPEVTGHRRWQR